jgi:hypothetical protein
MKDQDVKQKVVNWIHFIGTITILILLIIFAHIGRKSGYQEGLNTGFVRGIKCTNFAIQNEWTEKTDQEFGNEMQKCLDELEEVNLP